VVRSFGSATRAVELIVLVIIPIVIPLKVLISGPKSKKTVECGPGEVELWR
jgi:hypothetical protein